MEQGTPGNELTSFHLFHECPYERVEDDCQSQYSTTDSQIPQPQQQTKTPDDDDLRWSIYSNIFFVTGCAIYLIVTSWDLIIHTQSDSADDLRTVLNTPQYIIYQLLWVTAPFVYLLNSYIDVRWASIARERDARGKEQKLRKLHLESILNTAPQGHSRKRLRINAVLKRPQKLLRRMRKHIGHRRQVGAASFFGFAALLSIVAALLGLLGTETAISQDTNNTLSVWVGWLESGSVHVCLVSACLALWKSPWKSPADNVVVAEPVVVNTGWYFRPESLETLGDVFFGAAAIVDVCLQNSTLDDGIYWWPVFSAILCLFDSLFYLISDIVTLYKD